MKKKILIILSYLLVAAVAVTGTLYFTGGYSKLDEIEALIENCFIGEVDMAAVEDAAANAMVSATNDRWSYYLSAEEYETHLERVNNAYVGIGITIQLEEEEGYRITQVTAGGPAEEAGLEIDDLLINADGEDLRQLDIEAVRDIVKGKEGTNVSLKVLRKGEVRSFNVERRSVETPVATYEMVTDTIGLVTIANFDSRCAEESIAAIEALQKQGAKKLIFDVRYNPGGYAHELVDLLDYLLPEGDLFRTVRYDGKENVDTSDANYLDMPMAVLVNANSYSAAEFFAAALQEYEAAVIVGQQTVGKGYFQTTYVLEDGSALALSIGEYYTPKGVNLAGTGITPDVEVEMTEEQEAGLYYGTLTPEEDPQIQAAIAALK